MRACTRAGLRAPEVLLDDDGTHLGTPGLVMRRVPGETIARRILRDDEYAAARARARAASWPSSSPGCTRSIRPRCPGTESPDPMAIWDKYQHLEQRSAVFDKTHDWLLAHRPPHTADALIHGDLRMGNVIVDHDGLAAVIDWELIHRGDPHEDLAWLCLKAWRFGQPLEVGGLGTLDELVAAYEAAGGRRDRPRHVALVAGGQDLHLGGRLHAAGRHAPVGPSAFGRPRGRRPARRRAGVGPHRAARPRRPAQPRSPRLPRRTLPDDDDRYGRPTARELLDTVREFLTERVAPERRPRARLRGARRRQRAARSSSASSRRSPSTDRDGDDWDTLALDRPRPPRGRQPEAPDAAAHAAAGSTDQEEPTVTGPTSDVWEAMSTARTIRRFTDEPVDDATLAPLLPGAPRWAPSGGNSRRGGSWSCGRPSSAPSVAAGGRARPRGDRAGLQHDPPRPRRRQPRPRAPTARPTSSTTAPASSRRCCSRRCTSPPRRSCCSAGRSSRRCRTSCSPPGARARRLPDELGVVRGRGDVARRGRRARRLDARRPHRRRMAPRQPRSRAPPTARQGRQPRPLGRPRRRAHRRREVCTDRWVRW